jgi:hypothetical protein
LLALLGAHHILHVSSIRLNNVCLSKGNVPEMKTTFLVLEIVIDLTSLNLQEFFQAFTPAR